MENEWIEGVEMDKLDKFIEISPEEEGARIIDFIRESAEKLNKDGVIFGLSGGIDSSLVASLAKEAFPDNSLALILPEKDSSEEDMRDAKQWAEKLNLEYEKIDITPILEEFGTYELVPDIFKKSFLVKLGVRSLKFLTGKKVLHSLRFDELLKRRVEARFAFAFGMSKLRVRMIMLYKYGFLKNYTVLGTTNKTEYLLGHYDIHGDGAVDIECLLHLYKTQVRKMARFLRVDEIIIEKAPSPDLVPGLTDEEVMGISFEKIDRILVFIEKGMDESEAGKYGLSKREVKEVKEAISNSVRRRERPLSLLDSSITK
ncbi:NAD(+) synthase [candidate division WOR-3 bacterium]|nr:NAD(+) synthase [candidate division WOR-3 bacterium]